MTSPQVPVRRFYLSDIAATLFLAALIVPILGLSLRGLRGAWALFAIWAVMAFFHTSPSSIYKAVKDRKLEVIGISLWLAVVVVNAALGRGYTGISHFFFTTTLIMVWTMELVVSTRGPYGYAFIVGALLLLVGFDAARSVPSLLSIPGYPRVLMMDSSDETTQFAAARVGVGDYNLYTANAFGLPSLIIFAIHRFRVLFPSIIACLGIFAAISLSTLVGAFTIAAAALTLLAAMYLLFARKSGIGLIAVMFFIAGPGIIWMWTAGGTDQGEFIVSKLQRLFVGVSSAGLVAGDETGRGDLFQLSWETFAKNWLIGIGPSTTRENPNLYREVGGHSSVADMLAEYGLVGCAPYGLFFGAIALRIFRSFRFKRSRPQTHPAVICMLFYALFAFTNPIVFSPSVMVMVFFVTRGCFEMSNEDRQLNAA